MCWKVSWSAAAFVAALLGSAQAQTLEVVTRCPQLSPSDGKTPVSHQALLHFGEVRLGDAPIALGFETRRFAYVLEDVERDGYRNAALSCGYYDRAARRHEEVRIPIPGLLLSCDRITEIRSNPREYFPIRFFCISRIEAPAR